MLLTHALALSAINNNHFFYARKSPYEYVHSVRIELAKMIFLVGTRITYHWWLIILLRSNTEVDTASCSRQQVSSAGRLFDPTACYLLSVTGYRFHASFLQTIICVNIWCTTQLAKLSFNHSHGSTHSWRFSTFYKKYIHTTNTTKPPQIFSTGRVQRKATRFYKYGKISTRSPQSCHAYSLRAPLWFWRKSALKFIPARVCVYFISYNIPVD